MRNKKKKQKPRKRRETKKLMDINYEKYAVASCCFQLNSTHHLLRHGRSFLLFVTVCVVLLTVTATAADAVSLLLIQFKLYHIFL